MTDGFFLSQDPSLFDAPFFSITAKEAAGMDPMQRMLLEVAYETFENAGVLMNDLPRTKTSVYSGCMTRDYELLSTHDIYDMGQNAASGNGTTMLSNRISWFFDLWGPSLSLDTACSSSLYALHLACQSLRLGESKQALVTGSNLLLYPNMTSRLSDMHMLSADGVSHTFDERANGYGRGEAIGAVLVKPLKDALEHGDTIRAIIRGTGANQDGKTPGITMPRAEAQAQLIRDTYASAGLPLADTGYFEAHGTGTGLGDPIELSAIGATFGEARKPGDPLHVGSVKASIGHTEGTAGLAGVLKAVHLLEKGMLVPNAGFENLNPKLKLDDWNITLPMEVKQWPSPGLRRISVNSFGFGGANSHVILDDAYHYLRQHRLTGNHHTSRTVDESQSDSGFSSDSSSSGPNSRVEYKLFPFSTQDQVGLQRVSAAYSKFLERKDSEGAWNDKYEEDIWLKNLAYTLSERRTRFDFRSFMVAKSASDLQMQLEKGLPKQKRVSKHENVIWVFTGQGAQWPAMGRELLAHEVFQSSMMKSQAFMESWGCGWDIFEELQRKEGSRINSPDFSQPICTALQIALVDLLTHWGLSPKAVVGHSSGEIGAAYAAGALPQDDAMKAAYFRGLYSADVNRRLKDRTGTMMAVGLSEQDSQKYIDHQSPPGTMVVACINSPSSVTLSGDDSSVSELEKVLQKDGVFARKLRTGTAYHSHHMQVISNDYLKSMGEIKTVPSNTSSPKMFSSVTCTIIDFEELDASYWVRNMTNPVRFSDAVKAILQYSESRVRRKTPVNWSAMVEIGPHEALKGPLNQIMQSIDSKLATSMLYTGLVLRGQDAASTALKAAGVLWSSGHSVDLLRLNQEGSNEHLISLTDLPSYPWNHSKGFWHEPKTVTDQRFAKHPRTDLLGYPVENFNSFEPQWRNFLRLTENPWMEDHKITDAILYPGAGMLIMAMEAAQQLADGEKKLRGFEFRDVTFDRGLVIPSGDQAVETSLSFRHHKSLASCYHFTVFSLPEGSNWLKHCFGTISLVYEAQDSEIESQLERNVEWRTQTEISGEIQRSSTMRLDCEKFYEELRAAGMGYGPLFANMTEASVAPGKQVGHGKIAIPDTKSSMPKEFEYPHLIHPATLDAIFHLIFVASNDGNVMKESAVPVNMDSMFISASLPQGAGAKFVGSSRIADQSNRGFSGNLIISDEHWSEPKVVVNKLAVQKVSSSDDEIKSTFLESPRRTAQIQWKEDVDDLTGPDAARFLQREAAWYSKEDHFAGQVGAWLDRACHKHPISKAMIVGDAVPSTLAPLLSRFGRQSTDLHGITHFTLVETSEEAASKLKSLMDPNSEIDVKVLDLTKPIKEQGFEPESFDLIICDFLFPRKEASTNAIMARVKESIRPNGYLACAGQKSDISSSLLSAGFSNVSMCVENEHFDFVVASVYDTPPFKPEFEEIYIIEPREMTTRVSNLNQNLTKTLERQGLSVKHSKLSESTALEGKAAISLLEVEDPLIINWGEEEFSHFKKIVLTASYVLWITRGAQVVGSSSSLDFSPAVGLLRTMRVEMPQLTMPHLDLSLKNDVSRDETATLVSRAFSLSLRENGSSNEMEFVEKEGRLCIPRVIDDKSFDHELELHSKNVRPVLGSLTKDSRPLVLAMARSRDPDSIMFHADQEADGPLQPNEVEYITLAVSLNAADLQATLGQIESPLGREAAGIVSRVGKNIRNLRPGERVVGMKFGGAFRTNIRQDVSLVEAIPDSMSTQDAASIPTAFMTAYHALVQIARIGREESVLIHSAAGGVGQAAILIARLNNTNIFATVGSKEKKDFLIKQYGLPESHIFDSRSTAFFGNILHSTNGRGLDVVLSSIGGENLRRSCDCLAKYGRLVHIGKGVDVADLSPSLFKRSVSFTSVDLDNLAFKSPTAFSNLFKTSFKLVQDGLISQLPPVTALPISNLSKTLKSMGKGEHIGKKVINFDRDAQVPIVPVPPPHYELDHGASYVLSGGLGALGLEIAQNMVEHGARHLIFLSRSGASTEAQQQALARFEARGCKADALKCDVNDKQKLAEFIESAKVKGWKIKGVVQAAMVMRVSFCSSMMEGVWPPY